MALDPFGTFLLYWRSLASKPYVSQPFLYSFSHYEHNRTKPPKNLSFPNQLLSKQGGNFIPPLIGPFCASVEKESAQCPPFNSKGGCTAFDNQCHVGVLCSTMKDHGLQKAYPHAEENLQWVVTRRWCESWRLHSGYSLLHGPACTCTQQNKIHKL